MGKVSTLGWIAIIGGAIFAIDFFAHAEQNIQRYSNTPESEAEQQQKFAAGSEQAKQEVLQNMNGVPLRRLR